MDKFFCDLETVLEKYNHDVTALDDYEVTYHSTFDLNHFLQLFTMHIFLQFFTN